MSKRAATLSRPIFWKRVWTCTPFSGLVGHTSIKSTLRYFHVARGHILDTPSPLDMLDDPRFEDK